MQEYDSEMSRLDSIAIRGFRSIGDVTFELRPLNVLIGANGAGKSNVVSFFKMMNELMGGRLQQFVATTAMPAPICILARG